MIQKSSATCEGQFGDECIFPFVYAKYAVVCSHVASTILNHLSLRSLYYSCVKEFSWSQPWCAVRVNDDQESILWQNCNDECPVCETTDGGACKFPFNYEGYRHHGCVVRDGVSSCATDVNTEFDVVSWGQCNGFCPGKLTKTTNLYLENILILTYL